MRANNKKYTDREAKLTLKKEELLSDKKIYKRLGYQDDVDKVNSQIKKVNNSIKELQEAFSAPQTDRLKTLTSSWMMLTIILMNI